MKNRQSTSLTAAVTGLLLIFLVAKPVEGQDDPLAGLAFGDIPLSEEEYEESILPFDTLYELNEDAQSVAEFDARARGWVTSAKNQGNCGSCWAFATAGTIESRILKEFGTTYDLSEQQLVSCHTGAAGCCGGSGSSLKFYYQRRPMEEGTAPYAEANTSCPTERTVPCASISGDSEPYLVSGFYTVDRNLSAIKTSVFAHGPSYFRYDVYDDFGTYWNSASPGDVYTNTSNTRRGGHAVLIIGWSDSKKAFLCKNSWGPNSGPNNDGTFWIAYSGHANDLGLQMFNITTITRLSTIPPEIGNKQKLLGKFEEPVEAALAPGKADLTVGPFEIDPVLLESLANNTSASKEMSQPNSSDAAASFGWYNNLRVNGSTTLTDTAGTTQISVYARDVKWRFGFGSRAIESPTGDGGVSGAGWQFPNAHRFGIVVVQGNNYWNVNSTSSSSPTIITGLSNTQPVTIYVNDTNGALSDNGGSFDLYLRKDN